MLTNVEIIEKIHELKEMEKLLEEVKSEVESLRDTLKQELITLDREELTVSNGKEVAIIRYTSVLSSRFDTKRFKDELGDELYKKYTREISSKRFSIA